MLRMVDKTQMHLMGPSRPPHAYTHLITLPSEDTGFESNLFMLSLSPLEKTESFFLTYLMCEQVR